jgi:hypothetical protein
MNSTNKVHNPSPPNAKACATDTKGEPERSACATEPGSPSRAETDETASPVEDQANADPASHAAVVSQNYDVVAPIEKEQEGCLAAQMPFHPLANIFPLPDDEELRALADDIKHRGLLESITTLDSEILDGRCRYRACRMAGVEPGFVLYSGEDPVGFVLSKNVRRRHLNESRSDPINTRRVRQLA